MAKYKNKEKGNVFTWSPDEAREYFFRKGITEEDIGNLGGSFSGLQTAGELFCEKKFHNFSGVDLALILNTCDWGEEGKSKKYLKQVYADLSERYRKYALIKEELGIPYTHFLRIETGNNKSNLHKLGGYEIEGNRLVKRRDEIIYPKIKTSWADWKDGVCLPLPEEINGEAINLLADLLCYGHITKKSELFIYGRETRRDKIENEILPLAEKIFNIPFINADQGPEILQLWGKKDVQCRGVARKRGSRAICSFLKYEVPAIPFDEIQVDTFLRRVIKERGYYTQYGSKKDLARIDIGVRKESVAQRIGDFLTSAGHSYSGPRYRKGKGSWDITLNKEPSKYFKDVSAP